MLQQHLRELSKHYPLWIDNAYTFVVVENVPLPAGYNCKQPQVLVELPKDYPQSPPGVGNSRVYVPANLRYDFRILKDVHQNRGPWYSTPGFGPWASVCYQWIRWDPRRDDLIIFLEMVRANLWHPPAQ